MGPPARGPAPYQGFPPGPHHQGVHPGGPSPYGPHLEAPVQPPPPSLLQVGDLHLRSLYVLNKY